MTRVLIVEDNELSLDMLSRRMRRKGHVIITDPTRAVCRRPAGTD